METVHALVDVAVDELASDASYVDIHQQKDVRYAPSAAWLELIAWNVVVAFYVNLAASFVYQWHLRGIVACRFTPTCSWYGHESIRKYGVVIGGVRTAWRIARCGSWTKGGDRRPAIAGGLLAARRPPLHGLSIVIRLAVITPSASKSTLPALSETFRWPVPLKLSPSSPSLTWTVMLVWPFEA